MWDLHAAAVRNNAEWCAAVCRSHGLQGTFGETAWWSPRRTPAYYPDAVTLRPDAEPADLLARIDTASPGCSVKDSHATLDLAEHGFAELFTAQWIHRAAGLPAPHASPLTAVPVTTGGQLRTWQTTWRGGPEAPDAPEVFRPALLADTSVAVLAFHAGDDLAGGVILNHAAGVVGVSNLFATENVAPSAVWSSSLAAAARYFPGLPLVGYEHGADLAPALATGFTPIGPLRVWLRTC